jgi:putative ABC transport system ATP-binding protein
MPLLQIHHLTKQYRRGDRTIVPLRDVSLEVQTGDFLALVGASGSGKTTLLNLLVGLDRPSAGQVVVGGIDLGVLAANDLARWRAGHVGYVLQLGNLIPLLSISENVELPLRLLRRPLRERRRQVAKALDAVGLSAKARRYPTQLSGGEVKRAGIARAVAAEPDFMAVDEPTAELDVATGEQIMALLRRLNLEQRTTIVMASHNPAAVDMAHRHLRLEDGQLWEMEASPRRLTG